MFQVIAKKIESKTDKKLIKNNKHTSFDIALEFLFWTLN